MSSKSKISQTGINTRLAHTGHDPRSFHGFVNPPVVHASTVLFPDSATMVSRNQKYTYGTYGTPTTDALTSAIRRTGGLGGNRCAPFGPRSRHPSLHGHAERRRPFAGGRFGLHSDAQLLPWHAGAIRHRDHLL
jgi:hypothetical protein